MSDSVDLTEEEEEALNRATTQAAGLAYIKMLKHMMEFLEITQDQAACLLARNCRTVMDWDL